MSKLVLPPVVLEVIGNLVAKRVYLLELSKTANGKMAKSQTSLMYYDMAEFLGVQIDLLQGMKREPGVSSVLHVLHLDI